MKKEKSKSAPKKQGGMFTLLWSLSYAGLWLMFFVWMFLTYNNSTIRGPSFYTLGYVGMFIIAGLVAFMQQRLLQRPIKGWILASLFGTLLAFGLFDSSLGVLDNTMLMPSLALLVPTSIVQMFWLRRHVKSAWLWPLTNIVAAMSFAFLFRDDNAAKISSGFIGLGLLQGIVQAVVMRYLWSQPQEDETPKQLASADHETDMARLHRLQEETHIASPVDDEYSETQQGKMIRNKA